MDHMLGKVMAALGGQGVFEQVEAHEKTDGDNAKQTVKLSYRKVPIKRESVHQHLLCRMRVNKKQEGDPAATPL